MKSCWCGEPPRVTSRRPHLVRKYNVRLYNFVRSMVRNDELAEDITQEALVKAYFNLNKLQNTGSFKELVVPHREQLHPGLLAA